MESANDLQNGISALARFVMAAPHKPADEIEWQVRTPSIAARKNGAQVGKHLVYIETLEEGGGGDYGGGRAEEVPKRYNSESKLNVEVTSGSNTIDFLDLTSDGDKNMSRPEAGY